MNKAAFFDIDGTLYKNSLLISHYQRLIKEIPVTDKIKEIRELERLWKHGQGDYEAYVKELALYYCEILKEFKQEKVLSTSKKVIEKNFQEVYFFTKEQIKLHKEKGDLVFFVSGSPDFLVEEMAKKYEIDGFKASKYKFKDGFFTGDVSPMWDKRSKRRAINELSSLYNLDLKNCYSYGDTNGDYSMFEMTGKNILINPSQELILRSHKLLELGNEVEIIIQRKDVTYKMSPEYVKLFK